MFCPLCKNVMRIIEVIRTADDTDKHMTVCDHCPDLSMAQIELHCDKIGTPTDNLTSLESVKMNYVQHVVEACGGNKSKAAKILKVSVRGLRYYLNDPIMKFCSKCTKSWDRSKSRRCPICH